MNSIITTLAPSLAKISDGQILYLIGHHESSDRLHPGMPRECLDHPVVVLDAREGAKDDFVDVLIVNDSQNTMHFFLFFSE